MRPYWLRGILALALASAWLMNSLLQSQETPPPPGGADAKLEGNAEVLTRGPVHEAFAEPYSVNAEASMVVPKQPPEPIDEIPPETMPAGDNVDWIQGYWAWDDDRNDFIWISGVWRDLPPSQRWVPGSWVQAGNGYQWTAGFWTPEQTQDITYLPPPPESQEQGPNSPAPDDDHFWVPGTWRFVNSNYSWQPGYWAPAQQNWCWVPARYVWSPYGYIYCDGYWDYDVLHRGILFSPVYFPTYQYPQYVPSNVVSIGPLMIHFFVRPRYCHYYFGDYYGDAYANAGIMPWIGMQQYPSYGYDPLFAYYQTGFFNNVGGGGGFLSRLAGWHNYYRGHPDFRPRHTLADTRAFVAERGNRDAHIIQQASLTRSLADLRNEKDHEIELRDVPQPQREQFRARSREVNQLQKLRAEHQGGDNAARRGDRRIALPQVDRREHQGSVNLPQRPDSEAGRSRSSARPDLNNPPPERERGQNRPQGRPRPETPGANPPETNQPGREKQQQQQRHEQEPQAGRRRMQLPDAPADGQQDVTPIPRPSESPRRGIDQQRSTRRPGALEQPEVGRGAPNTNRDLNPARPLPERRNLDPRPEGRTGQPPQPGGPQSNQPPAGKRNNPPDGRASDNGSRDNQDAERRGRGVGAPPGAQGQRGRGNQQPASGNGKGADNRRNADQKPGGAGNPAERDKQKRKAEQQP